MPENRRACVNVSLLRTLPSGITEEQLLHLRSLVRKFEAMQQARISFENQMRAINYGTTQFGRLGFILEKGIVEGVDKSSVEGVGKKKILGIKCYEDVLKKEMQPIVESHRLWIEWLRGIKGIGILSAAKLIAYFEPYWAEIEIVLRQKKQIKGKILTNPKIVTQKLYRPNSRSSLIKLCGYAVDDKTGRAYRLKHGEVRVGNPHYAQIFYIIFEAVLRQKGQCYKIWKQMHEQIKLKYPNYLEENYGAKTREEAKKENPKIYIPNIFQLSRRKFIKVFISLLWEKMQELYGLPITVPQHCRDTPLSKKEWIHPLNLCEL